MGATVPFGRCRAWLIAAAVVVAGVMGSTPRAMAADDPASAEAKKHYEEGTKAFNLGEYPRAIAEFKATYNAKPDPLLLYNIAQSYRLAGDANQALFFYKSFLRNMPGATNRKEVEGQIHKLEKQLADQKKDPASTPPAAVVPPPTATTPPMAATPPPVVTPPPPPPVTPLPRSPEPDRHEAPPPFAPVTTAPPPATTEPHVDLTAPAPTPGDQPEDHPFYKKWWFWVGAAGVVVLLGGIAAANAKKPPTTSLGLYDPTFM